MSPSCVPGVWMASLETRCLVQGSTVGPAPALVTLPQITSTGTPVKLTTPRIRSSVTANKASLVSYYTAVTHSSRFLKCIYHFSLLWVTWLINHFTKPGEIFHATVSAHWSSLKLHHHAMFSFSSLRVPLWPVCPWLLWQPRTTWWTVCAMQVQRQHRHSRSWVMWSQNRPMPQVPVPHRRPIMWHLSAWLLWQRFGPRLQA